MKRLDDLERKAGKNSMTVVCLTWGDRPYLVTVDGVSEHMSESEYNQVYGALPTESVTLSWGDDDLEK